MYQDGGTSNGFDLRPVQKMEAALPSLLLPTALEKKKGCRQATSTRLVASVLVTLPNVGLPTEPSPEFRAEEHDQPSSAFPPKEDGDLV